MPRRLWDVLPAGGRAEARDCAQCGRAMPPGHARAREPAWRRTRVCAGLAVSLLWLVGIGLPPAAADAPAASLTHLLSMNGPPLGGFLFTVRGQDIAIGDFTFGMRVGGTSCEFTIWNSVTQLTCKIAAGFFPSNVVTATVRFNIGTPRVEIESSVEPCPCYTFSYDQPDLLGVVNSGGPTTGSTPITFVGKNFVDFDITPRARLGATACQFTRWISDSCLIGRNSASVLADQSSVITAVGRMETRFNLFTYDRPKIAYVYFTNSRTAGEGTVTLVGSGFGSVDLTQRTRMGETACLASNWVADSTLLCKLAAETKTNLGLTVSVSRRFDLRPSSISFDDPMITAISPVNVPMIEPRRVSILGFNFGGQVHDPRASRFGDTSCLKMTWYSDTAISCMTQPGYADNLFATVTIAQVEDSRALMSYNTPLITSIFRSNGPASGSSEFSIHGNFFGGFELTPMIRVGNTLCMRTGWISESTVVCKAPRVEYDKWFLGKNVPVKIFVGSANNQVDRAYTYDVACVGPCVIGLACPSSTGGFGCSGPTHGDYRHPINSDIVKHRGFGREHVVRIIGNFTLRGGNNDVVVGNFTHNRTIQVTEEIYSDDITVTFGDMYECIPLPVPRIAAQSTAQQYLDCVMPVGVGHGHSIKVTIRNATYKALLDACTPDMKSEPVLPSNPWRGIWPPLLPGEVMTPDRNYGNCLLPTSVDEKVRIADDIGVSFSYSAPIVIKLTPDFGMNSAILGSAIVKITGENFGGEARRIWGPVCRNSQLRACRQLFQNAVALFNFSCPKIDLLLTPSTGGEMERETATTKLAYCKTHESYMVKCKNPFSPQNLQCETFCPPGLLQEDDTMGLCKTFCSETKLQCQPEAMGGSQEVNVVIGDHTLGKTATFSYHAPEVYSVFPPELASGSSSLLTVMGKNFGVDWPSAYAGRVYQTGGVIVLLSFNPKLVPFNASSIAWWDDAQYSACFSTQTGGAAKRQKKETIYDRKCDQGDIKSYFIGLSQGTHLGQPADEMLIQAPPVNLMPGEAVTSVDVIVASLGFRSEIDPDNATLRFRASCGEVEGVIAQYSTQWYMGANRAGFTERSSFEPISYKNKVFLLGGESKAQPVMAEIWYSTFNGVATYSQMTSAFPWWAPRFNTTAVVHKEIMFLLGGEGRMSDGGRLCYNDIWVYADEPELEAYYKTKNTPSPLLAKGELYVPYWIEVTRDFQPRGAPWAARRNAYAISFKGRVWLIGGRSCDVGDTYFTDLWSSADMRTWRMDRPVAMWRDRTNIFAAAHNGAIYVMASVKSQFYNTFVSTDGVNYFVRDNACALTHVDVLSMVAFSGYLLAFTIGCHNQLNFNQIAVPCTHPYAGPLENRIYMTTNGKSWYITVQPFSVDYFEKAVAEPYPWSSTFREWGELRYNFKAFVHMDTMFLVGGQKNQAPINTLGKPFIDQDTGQIYLTQQRLSDVWVSKAMLPSREICIDKFDQGLTSSMRQEKIESTWRQLNCNIFWSELRVRWRSKAELDFDRGYIKAGRRQLSASQAGAEDEAWDMGKRAEFANATRSAQTTLEHIQHRLAALKPTLKAVVRRQLTLQSSTFPSVSLFSSSTATSTSSPSSASSSSPPNSSPPTSATTPTSVSSALPPSPPRSTPPAPSSPASPTADHASHASAAMSATSSPTAKYRSVFAPQVSRSLASPSPTLVALEEVEQAEEEMQRLRHLVSRVSEELDASEPYAPNESREHALS